LTIIRWVFVCAEKKVGIRSLFFIALTE
jgi:hypothetical protein